MDLFIASSCRVFVFRNMNKKCSRCGTFIPKGEFQFQECFENILCSHCLNYKIDSLVSDQKKQKDILFDDRVHIYFIIDLASKAIKIGYSKNLKKRLNSLQISNPNKIKLIKSFNNRPKSFEKSIQEKYKKYVIRGEWFSYEILNLL